MKRLIAFDLDDTLAITKSPISDRMSQMLTELLNYYEVCVISGGAMHQFEIQVLKRLSLTPDQLSKLHLLPTCGTRYYKYDTAENKWKLQYAEDLTPKQKKRIMTVLEESAKEMGIWCESPAGEIIEDRFSQITLSALGQQAAPADKYAWAKKYKDIRPVFRDKVAEKLPDLEVRIGGTTSTDITLPGVDKAFGVRKLLESTDHEQADILFIGDKLEEGGNDYPVKAMGIDCIEVSRWEDTANILEGIIHVTK